MARKPDTAEFGHGCGVATDGKADARQYRPETYEIRNLTPILSNSKREPYRRTAGHSVTTVGQNPEQNSSFVTDFSILFDYLLVKKPVEISIHYAISALITRLFVMACMIIKVYFLRIRLCSLSSVACYLFGY